MCHPAEGKQMMPLSNYLLQTLSTNFSSFSVWFKAAGYAKSKKTSCFPVLYPTEMGFVWFACVLELFGV